jgi:hypothetical protein
MRQHFLAPLLLLSLALSACALSNIATPVDASQTQTVEPASATPVPSLTGTPAITPASDNCAYVWASHDLPGLSQKVAASLEALDPNVTGSAYAYGEDCVYGDGHSTFSAMETDFRVKVAVDNLANEEALGNRIAQVMDVITQLPADQLSGPQPGRVQFEFSKSATETLFLNVSIAKYKSQAAGLSGAEIFRLFNNNP